MKRVLVSSLAIILLALIVVTIVVEWEAAPHHDVLGGTGAKKALILYHPSRDAHFSDELSVALAKGLVEGGLTVERATTTRALPDTLQGYALIVVVANTYYWTPDLPTLRYLGRAHLNGLPAIGIIGGAGATGRSERLLGDALRASGAQVLFTHSYWILRPNDETRLQEPNRQVALNQAEALGLYYGRRIASQP